MGRYFVENFKKNKYMNYWNKKWSRNVMLGLSLTTLLTAVNCSSDDGNGSNTSEEVQVFDSCTGQDFVITEENPNIAWTPNAITLVSQEVAENVFAIYDQRAASPDLTNLGSYATSAGFVIGTNAVFMVESAANKQLVCQIYDLIRAQTNLPILYVGNTNHHFDHSFGNSYLPAEVQVVQHQGTAEFFENHFQEEMDFALANWGTDQNIQEASYRPADIVVDNNGWSVDLGGITVEAKYFGFAQTDGDLFFYVPERAVIFTGNSQLSEAPGIPWLLDGGAVASLESMKAVRDFLPSGALVVPGHGRPTDKAAIDFTIDYLDTLIMEVQSNIDAGNDLATTQANVLMTEFQGYSLWGFAHTSINVPNTFNDLQ